MIKNSAGQVVAFQMTNVADGSEVTTGTPTVYVTVDGGPQITGAGAAAHEGNGCWSYVPVQSETNGTHVAFTMLLNSAISQTVNVYPTVDFDALAADIAAIKTKTDFLPSATAGAAGGVFIAGTNAPVEITGSGVALSVSSTNTDAVEITGADTGAGLKITAGTGNASVGIKILSPNIQGTGIECAGGKYGIIALGASSDPGYGFYCLGGGTGSGIYALSGPGATGAGAQFVSQAVSGNGISVTGAGTGSGVSVLGGDGATGDGVNIAAQSTSGVGLRVTGTDVGMEITSTTEAAVVLEGGTGILGGGAHGVSIIGAGTGNGINVLGGDGASGDGVYISARSTKGNGMTAIGSGVGGVDILANIEGTINLTSTAIQDIWAEIHYGVAASEMLAFACAGAGTGLVDTSVPYDAASSRVEEFTHVDGTTPAFNVTVDKNGNRQSVAFP